MAATPDGRGYWLVAGDGGIFAYGDAVFHGTAPAPTGSVVAMTVDKASGGYWLIGSDGTIQPFDAPPVGALASPPTSPVVGSAGQ